MAGVEVALLGIALGVGALGACVINFAIGLSAGYLIGGLQ
jgi:hypothetical protein